MVTRAYRGAHLQKEAVGVGGGDVPALRVIGRAARVDEAGGELRARLHRIPDLERQREDALATRAEEEAGRLLLVVRLEELQETVLGPQHDVAGAEARHVARVLDAREAEALLVERQRTVEVADDEDDGGET